MSKIQFIGRKKELGLLSRHGQKKIANLVILQGRRRVGKSRMVEEFAKNKLFYRFAGLAPETKMTAQMQRDEFMRQMSEQFNTPLVKLNDWGDIFSMLAREVRTGKVIILFDEISWMAHDDPTFLGKVKNLWDHQLKKNNQLMLILCGSVSAWIQKNIISSTAFVGRPTLIMRLDELPLRDCIKLWENQAHSVSAYEKLKILSVTGGVPRYLELIDVKETAENNIRMLCFESGSPLRLEFEHIFNDVFGPNHVRYKNIVNVLVKGAATLDEISQAVKISKTGELSNALADLILAGFVAKDNTWNVREEKRSNLCKFRLKDNFTRFYLKFVFQNFEKIESGFFDDQSIRSIIKWDSIIGLQFENLVINNYKLIIQHSGILMEDVVFAAPFFQRKTNRQRGCQIDFMIQTRFNCLYIYEIKFSRHPLTGNIIDEVRQKIDRLQIPKNYSYRPVLIHVNGVSDSVYENGYFADIIDFADLLSG